MINLPKTKLIILAIIVVILIASGYFYFSQKPDMDPRPAENPPIEKKRLADDEKYIKEKVDYFLANNPDGTSEEYARDIVFHDIAVEERDAKICDKIKDDYWKEHCYRLLK